MKIRMFLTLLSALLFQLGCNNHETSPTASGGDPVSPAHEVKAVIIRSEGAHYTTFWDDLNMSWQAYGTTKVSVDYTSLADTVITEGALAASGADVLVIDDARNPMASEILSPSEVNAICKYTTAGHGLIITGGTFRPWEHQPLMPLLGYSTAAGGSVYFGEYFPDSIIITSGHPALLRNISNFKTNSTNFYSGGDWNYDGQSSYPDDWRVVLADPNAHILGFAWNLNHLVNEKQCTPISYIETSKYRAVYAGFRPSSYYASQDDRQFCYNAIVWCAKPGVRISQWTE